MTDTPLLDWSPPQNWRHGDPDTSRLAGESASEFASRHRRLILWAIKRAGRPVAAKEIANILGWESHVPVNRRLSELVDVGEIAPTDDRYTNPSGRTAVRYRMKT